MMYTVHYSIKGRYLIWTNVSAKEVLSFFWGGGTPFWHSKASVGIRFVLIFWVVFIFLSYQKFMSVAQTDRQTDLYLDASLPKHRIIRLA